MTSPDGLQRLTEMGQLVLEARTARLRKATEARDQLRAQLAALDRHTVAAANDLSLALAAYAYEGWAASRRAEIGLLLAARQAEWLIELEAAKQAFGRAQMLQKLAAARD